MLYTTLKNQLTTYLNSDLPKSLFWQGGFSKDITKTIELQIYRIDSVTDLKSKGIHNSAKSNLINILKAIENENFDVSKCEPAYFVKK